MKGFGEDCWCVIMIVGSIHDMFGVRWGVIFWREAEVVIVIGLLSLGGLWSDWLGKCWGRIRASVWRRTLISEVN